MSCYRYELLQKSCFVYLHTAPTPATPPPEIDGVKDKRGKKGKGRSIFFMHVCANMSFLKDVS